MTRTSQWSRTQENLEATRAVHGGRCVIDAVSHGKVVLGGILGWADVRLLDYVARYLTADHFEDRTQKALFTLIQRYADQTRGLLPLHALDDVLRGHAPGTALQYREYYAYLAVLRPSAPDFKHSVIQLRELRAERLTGEALAQSMTILREGATQGRQELRGHADARRHALAAFAEVDREAMHGESPEGDIRQEARKVAEAYAAARERRVSGQAAGIGTGVGKLDQALSGGLGNGEFCLVCGFSSAGKSQWVAHQCWHACVMQGKNVVLFASETTRSNMHVRILGRHSRLPQFGLQSGLNTKDIRAGTLARPGEYEAFKAVLKDFQSGSYGRCYIVQLPKGATLSTVEGRLAAISRQFPPDLVAIDYLGLLRPDKPSGKRNDDLALLLQDTKVLATSFNDGQGVPVLSPWQVNREGRKDVYQRGRYVMTDLGETAEAERTPDVVISILEPQQDSSFGRRVPLKLDVMKNREAERGVRVELVADFATSYFAEPAGPDGESLLGQPWMEED